MENQTSHLTMLCGRLINLSAIASIEVQFKASTMTLTNSQKLDVEFTCILMIQAKYYDKRTIIKVPLKKTMNQEELTKKFPNIIFDPKLLPLVSDGEKDIYFDKCLLTEKQRHRILTDIQKELPTGLDKQNLRNIIEIII